MIANQKKAKSSAPKEPKESKESKVSTPSVPCKTPQASEDRVAKEPLNPMEGNVSAAKRLHSELCKLYDDHGKLFADWWKGMNRKEKTEILKDITYDSLHDTKPPFEEVARDLYGGKNLSRALFEYNIENLTGPCECDKSCEHYCNERILHEMADWTTNFSRKEEMEFYLCNVLRNKMYFPDLFDGKLALVTPKEDGGFGEALVFDDSAPEDVKQKYKDLIVDGSLYDASVAQYITSRKVHSIRLLVKLFDEYQIIIRRCPSPYSVERLLGCRHCNRSCEDTASSKNCPTCKVAWFCCLGCMIAEGHETCPIGKECDSKVVFQ